MAHAEEVDTADVVLVYVYGYLLAGTLHDASKDEKAFGLTLALP